MQAEPQNRAVPQPHPYPVYTQAKELTPFKHEEVDITDSGFKCYLIPISSMSDDASVPKFNETLRELVSKQIMSTQEHEFHEPSVIQEQPTAECMEISLAYEPQTTKRSALPVMEISIENEVEASQRQKLDQSSPNGPGMKFWRHRFEGSPTMKDYSSLVAAEGLDSTLLNPVEETLKQPEIKVMSVLMSPNYSSVMP
jgi:hypothetical protein